ncbi:MAG: GerMN domain-containing protein [Bacteroidetes bacterium]|nr:GerMN domain-containing protein [Bacteroidota bacterium]
MKKGIIFIVILLVVLVVLFFISDNKTERGKKLEIVDFQSCAVANNVILESYPRQCRTADGRNFIEDIGNELEKSDLIRVDNPRPNQKIFSPLEISGQARGFWFFEADFPILLLDEKAQIIAQTIATFQPDPADESEVGWMTEDFISFKAQLNFPSNLSGQATLIFKKDNPSGLIEYDDQLIMPVILQNQESVAIKIFFNHSQLDPEFSCDKVFAVERVIPKTQAIARAGLEQLLTGPSEIEKINGYFTSLNDGVEIQKLVIENGVAKVDFNEQLEFQVGGSCRVRAIRAQIEETLKQFSTVDRVIVSIDGRTEDILQP